jgi:predicted NBD/HSP70 family sugar kinase
MAPTGETKTAPALAMRAGITQTGRRNLNERLLLSLIQRNKTLPRSELARQTGLSPQTASVITRKLENDGLIAAGTPVKGKVGKPTTPMSLAPSGVFSIGLELGRRRAELILVDFVGKPHGHLVLNYSYPKPVEVFAFVAAGLESLMGGLTEKERTRVVGFDVAAPYEMWHWVDLLGVPQSEFGDWKKINLREEIMRLTDLSVSVVNDATAACRAEHLFGRGREFRDYAYFYIGTFVGGGVVLNHAVFEGNQGNAGAFGALRAFDGGQHETTLINTASIHLLEKSLTEAGMNAETALDPIDGWQGIDEYLDPWIEKVGAELAKAMLSICAVIDFEAVLIDGAFPDQIRERIVKTAARSLAHYDVRGLIPPTVTNGTIGVAAKSLGAASGPIFAEFFLNPASSLD